MKSWLRLLGLKSLISVLQKHWCKVYLIHFLIIMVNYYIQFRTAVQVQAAKKILVVAIISDSSQVSTSLCVEGGSTSRSTSLYHIGQRGCDPPSAGLWTSYLHQHHPAWARPEIQPHLKSSLVTHTDIFHSRRCLTLEIEREIMNSTV